MAKTIPVRIGERDFELLSSIDMLPLTTSQMLKLSSTFSEPFSDEHSLRRRLRQLGQSRLIACWPYATASNGRSPLYFKLTRDGYRFLHNDEELPKRRYFEEISTGHHYHTQALSELVVHVLAKADQHGISLRQFARENSLRLEASGFTVFPDCAFRLLSPDGRAFNFVVELDNGTERIRSTKDVESIERKLRAYDLHQAKYDARHPGRYLVLFVTARSAERSQKILDLAASTMTNNERTVFLATDLAAVLQCDPFASPVFRNHRGLHRTLIPVVQKTPHQSALSVM